MFSIILGNALDSNTKLPTMAAPNTGRRTISMANETHEAILKTLAYLKREVSIQELSRAAQVNITTLRKALSNMEGDGVVRLKGQIVVLVDEKKA